VVARSLLEVFRRAPRTPPRLLALLVFRNEMRYLPGYFQNVAPHVDGVVALDDGSTDGSTDFVAAQPSVLELIVKRTTEPHVWDERITHAAVIRAALAFAPDWLIAVDADERLERRFRARVQDEIARPRLHRRLAYTVRVRELWDRPDRWRVDGIWGRKRQARLFQARRNPEIDPRPLHGHWAPLDARGRKGYAPADLIIYHLRMIHAADRERRRARYDALDPQHRWQSIGYDYLTDETGLRLESLPPDRDYEPLGR
jgi:hypothetical protein